MTPDTTAIEAHCDATMRSVIQELDDALKGGRMAVLTPLQTSAVVIVVTALAEQRRVIERMREALKKIDARRYGDRRTVTPDTAWEEFGRANRALCDIYDEARAALSTEQEESNG